ncbi:hypothetical protein [Streptomyces sp. HUAS TT7]|uniref:hypothetical protein n=1 Tax=Streptomyces sp. HUAS TT7 TaxID=3447507 RepID=UPI003F65A723
MHVGAALSHCCRLLAEMETAARVEQEMAARLLFRAHLEAGAVCLYIHIGGHQALERLARAEVRYQEGLRLEADSIRAHLAAARKEARIRRKGAGKENAHKAQWNAANPTEVAKSLTELPHAPQLKPLSIDRSEAIAEFGTLGAQELTVSEMVDTLTKWGPTRGFGTENLRILYLYYRHMSGLGSHTTMPVSTAESPSPRSGSGSTRDQPRAPGRAGNPV